MYIQKLGISCSLSIPYNNFIGIKGFRELKELNQIKVGVKGGENQGGRKEGKKE